MWRFYPQIEATSFDEEFARVRGINTHLVFVILLIITAIAIVLLQTFVGLVMVIAHAHTSSKEQQDFMLEQWDR